MLNFSAPRDLPTNGITAPPAINSTNVSYLEVSDIEHPVYDAISNCLTSILSPSLCLFGFTGNILNILVLSRRRMQASKENKMERTACMGLIALALSDMLYCMCAFPEAFHEPQFIYTEYYFWMYYSVYNTYLRNTFSYWSTWLTVNLAVGRYVAICHPLHARIFVNPGANKLIIVLSLLFWVLLLMPEAFMYTVVPPGTNETGYFVDVGIYHTDPNLQITFSYLYTIVGFVVPVSLLAFCNVQLIRALKESYRMRKEYRVHGKNPQTTSKITPTLITIVIMFIILVSPSEILNIITMFNMNDPIHHTQLAIAVTNILHTINFSINFVLYCVVNVHFREALRDLFCCCFKRKRFDRGFTASYSNVTTKSFVTGHMNNETAL